MTSKGQQMLRMALSPKAGSAISKVGNFLMNPAGVPKDSKGNYKYTRTNRSGPGGTNPKYTAKKRKKKNWIAGAIKKPGALHRQLGVSAGKKIPAGKLASAASKGGKLGQRARLAETLKGFHSKRKSTHHKVKPTHRKASKGSKSDHDADDKKMCKKHHKVMCKMC